MSITASGMRAVTKVPAILTILAVAIVALAVVAPPPAHAGGRESLLGPFPWDFTYRNRETSFAYQYAKKYGGDIGGIGGIVGAAGGTVIINSTSTSVGNWQQIEMTLGDGAEGLIMTENHQDNSGDAQAVSDVLNKGSQALSNSDSTSSSEYTQHGDPGFDWHGGGDNFE